MHRILTIGTGRTTERDFHNRILAILNDGYEPLTIVDIRRRDSRSRNRKWCYQGSDMLGKSLQSGILEERSLVYEIRHELSNPFGRDLMSYREAILDLSGMWEDVVFLADDILKGREHRTYCLLCSERRPFKPGKEAVEQKPNCHRIILADTLLEMLKRYNKEWEVFHYE